MCDGGTFSLPIATALLGVASTMTQAEAANQQAKAQAEYQQLQAAEYARTAELNNRAALREYSEQSAAESIKEMQENAATAREKQAIQADALQKKGTMLASTNAAGMALDYMLMDYDRQAGVQMDTLDEQQSFNAASHEINKESFKRRAENTIQGQQAFISQGTSGGASTIGTMLGIGSSVLSGVNLYHKYQNKTSTDSPAGKKPSKGG